MLQLGSPNQELQPMKKKFAYYLSFSCGYDKLLQLGSEILTCLDLKWSKGGWLANGPCLVPIPGKLNNSWVAARIDKTKHK